MQKNIDHNTEESIPCLQFVWKYFPCVALELVVLQADETLFKLHLIKRYSSPYAELCSLHNTIFYYSKVKIHLFLNCDLMGKLRQQDISSALTDAGHITTMLAACIKLMRV